MAQWIEHHWDRFIDLTLAEDRLQSYWASLGRGRARSGTALGGLAGGGLLQAACWAVGLGACGYVLFQVARSGSAQGGSSAAAGGARRDVPAPAGV